MLKKVVNSAMVLSVCLAVGHAKPLAECKSDKDKVNGCVEKIYYGDRRQLRYETPYKNGERNGIEKAYYGNGQLEAETPYENDKINGIAKGYYESGQLFSEVPHENDKRSGIVKHYYESGQLKREIPFENDKRNGVEKEYYESGKLKKETLYEDGSVIVRKTYNEQGEIINSQQNK